MSRVGFMGVGADVANNGYYGDHDSFGEGVVAPLDNRRYRLRGEDFPAIVASSARGAHFIIPHPLFDGGGPPVNHIRAPTYEHLEHHRRCFFTTWPFCAGR